MHWVWPTGRPAQRRLIHWCEALAASGLAECVVLVAFEAMATEVTACCISVLPHVTISMTVPSHAAAVLHFERALKAPAERSVLLWDIEEDRRLVGALAMGNSELLQFTTPRLREVWVAEPDQAALAARMCCGSRVRVAPALWSPLELMFSARKEGSADVQYARTPRDATRGVEVVVLTDLCSPLADLLHPMLACDAADDADVSSIVVLTQSPLPERTKAAATALLRPQLQGKLKWANCAPKEVVPYFLKRAQFTAFVAHVV